MVRLVSLPLHDDSSAALNTVPHGGHMRSWWLAPRARAVASTRSPSG